MEKPLIVYSNVPAFKEWPTKFKLLFQALQLYQRSGKQPQNRWISEQEMSPPQNMHSPNTTPQKCYVCGSTKHLAHKYPKGKQEQESAVSGNPPQNNTGN